MAITVNSKEEAFKLVVEITGCDLDKNDCLTKRSGHDIYECPIENNVLYINDLNTCLEIIYRDGTSKNIWINEAKPEFNNPKSIKEKLTNKIYELIDKEEYDNIYKLLEIISDYKDIIE